MMTKVKMMMVKQQHNVWMETLLDVEDFAHWGGVLNPLAQGNVLQDFFALEPVLPYYPLFLGTAYEGLSRYSPILFSLPGPKHSFLQHLASLPPTWGFIWGGFASFEVVKLHWQSLLTVLLPSGVLSHLRFYSPSVLATLAEACTVGELAWLFGPCTSIFLPLFNEIGSRCEWLSAKNPTLLDNNDIERVAHTYQQNKPWWQVTDVQMQAFTPILRNVYLDNIVQQIWESHPVQAGEVENQYGSVRKFVETVVDAAHKYGFKTPEQEYKFLLLSLHYDVHADPSKEALQILESARRQPEYALKQLEKSLRYSCYE